MIDKNGFIDVEGAMIAFVLFLLMFWVFYKIDLYRQKKKYEEEMRKINKIKI